MEHFDIASASNLPHAPLIADIVSWGYGAAVIVAGLVFGVSMSLPKAFVVMALFLAMRAVARFIRAEHARSAPSRKRVQKLAPR